MRRNILLLGTMIVMAAAILWRLAPSRTDDAPSEEKPNLAIVDKATDGSDAPVVSNRSGSEKPRPGDAAKPSDRPAPVRHELIFEIKEAAQDFERNLQLYLAKADIPRAAELLLYVAGQRLQEDTQFIDPFVERHPELLEYFPLAQWWFSTAKTEEQGLRRLKALKQQHAADIDREQACYEFYIVKLSPAKQVKAMQNLVEKCLEQGREESDVPETAARDYYGEVAAAYGKAAGEAEFERLRSRYPWLRPLYPSEKAD